MQLFSILINTFDSKGDNLMHLGKFNAAKSIYQADNACDEQRDVVCRKEERGFVTFHTIYAKDV